jgi:hypothetical protein
VFFGLGSVGNGVESRLYCGPLLGMAITFLFFFIPYKAAGDVRGDGYLYRISLIVGSVACFLHLCNFIVLFVRPQTLRQYPGLKKALRGSLLVDLRDLKRASQHKVKLMTKNAMDLLGENDRGGVLSSHFGRGLHNFAVGGDAIENAGGFKWTWKRIFDNTVFAEYGLWFSTRLISSNIAQCIVSLYVLIAGISLTRNALENYDAERAKETISSVADYIFDTTVDEEILESILSNFTGLFGSFVDGDSFNCSRSLSYGKDFFDSVCEVSDDEIITCDPNAGADYLCAFADFAGNGTGGSEIGVTQKLALLQASGFDVVALQSTLQAALDHAANTSVDSLYPSSDYM